MTAKSIAFPLLTGGALAAIATWSYVRRAPDRQRRVQPAPSLVLDEHRRLQALSRDLEAERSDAAKTERVRAEDRHELSSLFGDHTIAPDARAAGEELLDSGAIEVPLGTSADRGYDPQLSKRKLLQPDTTGGALKEPPTYAEQSIVGDERMLETGLDRESLSEDEEDSESVFDEEIETVHLLELLPEQSEAYDALLPEDLGSEWLSRATEAPVLRSEPIDDLIELSTYPLSAVSQASDRLAGGAEDDSELADGLPEGEGAIPENLRSPR